MQLIWCLLSNFYLNMFRASLCPSSGEQECALPHMVFCTGNDGCGCVELGRVPAPHSHSHYYQCRTPYAAVHTPVLLMMGIMMPETCWDKSLIINIRLVASSWFLSLFTLMTGSFYDLQVESIISIQFFFLWFEIPRHVIRIQQGVRDIFTGCL